jgi:glycosyltransferase involved in cell wall biosynthesis
LYEDRLRGSGLRQLPLALASAFWRLEHASDQAEQMRAVVRKRTAASRKPRELRLLFLACYFPFGLMSGGHRRVQEMIRYFGSRHRLTLITSMRREQLAPARKEAFRYLEAVWGVEGSSRSAAQDANLPARVRQVYTDNMQAALHTLPTDQYHATLVDMIFMAEFRRDINSVKVLTEHNIESRLLRQAAGRSWRSTPPDGWQNATEEAVRLEKYEDRVWPEFPLRAVCSEADRACMDGRVKRGKTVVAPNGADPSIWLPRARRETATVLFPAHLGYPPNVDAVEFLLSEIWPKVRRRNAGARLILAGREPAEEVKSAAEGVPGLEIYPNPESMDQVARRASIMAVPLRLGSGTRLKILESMAWGLPVVSTTLGAEGIDAEDGEHLLIRDDPDSFGDAILRLMVDDPLWQKLRNRGRELVRERYAWDRVFKPLESALLELL